METLWQSLSVDRPYRPQTNVIAERTLKNICLSYLTGLDDKVRLALAEQQYDAASNMKQFHSIDCLSYEFQTDQLLDLDKKSRQIAARLMTPLTRTRKFEPCSWFFTLPETP